MYENHYSIRVSSRSWKIVSAFAKILQEVGAYWEIIWKTKCAPKYIIYIVLLGRAWKTFSLITGIAFCAAACFELQFCKDGFILYGLKMGRKNSGYFLKNSSRKVF